MTDQPATAHPFAIETLLDDGPPTVVLPRIRQTLTSSGVAVHDASEGFHADLPMGRIELRADGSATRLRLSAADKGALFTMRERVEARLREQRGDAAPVPKWTGEHFVEFNPPNFCKATVLQTETVGASFIRVRVTGENIARFFETALHFRLLMPLHPGTAPQWPTLDADGRTVWPKGRAELRRPVYTVRRFDRTGDWLEFDVYRHEGGATLAWAQDVQPGDEVGMLGPNGGWMPEAHWLLMAGDETAIPAMMRILEALPRDSEGEVLISIEDPQTRMPVDMPPSMNLRWIERNGDHAALLDAATSVEIPADEDITIWFAGRKPEALEARRIFREERGYDKASNYIAVYWD